MDEKIIYYKLISPYESDVTKNCKLTISDIDSNFLTFKDNDISGATFDEENKVIHIIKNNGTEINIDISSLSGSQIIESGITQNDLEISGSVDSNGVLTLNWYFQSLESDVKSSSISGFVAPVVSESNIQHDYSLRGKGTKDSLLAISNNEKTSYYKPAIAIVDELPITGMSVGDRYITKEQFNNHGYLYKKSALSAIKNMLAEQESIWRVASKEDWDNLLNYVEICDDDKNHNTEGDKIKLGKNAGFVLKSINGWSEEGLENNYDFSVEPIKPIRTSDYDYENLSESAMTSFWTTTSGYAKTFLDSTNEIYQDMPTDEDYLSIRLLCDYNSNKLIPYVEIFGDKYNVTYISSLNQLWIKQNLSYNIGNGLCVEPIEENPSYTSYYYINYWNGYSWERKQLETGDKVSIINGSNIDEYYVESYLNEQKLVKTISISETSGGIKINIDCGWY